MPLPLLSHRDVFSNHLEEGGEEWFVTLRGEEEAVSDVGVRYPTVTDKEDGSYTVPIKPGARVRVGVSVLLRYEDRINQLEPATCTQRKYASARGSKP